MNELIKIESREVSGSVVQTVNARALWQFVESKQNFSDWIKNRIAQYDFHEECDYTVHKIMTQYNQIDRIDYHLTLDAGKEVAMVENNEKGRQVRRYFIECERRAKTPAIPAELSRMQLISMAMEAEQERLILVEQKAVVDEQLAIAAPKADALDMISAGTQSMTMTETAKIIGVKRKDLAARMHAEGMVYRQNGSLVAYDKHIKNGNLEYKEAKYTDDKTGMEVRKPYCHVTPKGLTRLAMIFSPMSGALLT